MLSRLSLRGFKSFADNTSLELGPGVNVVVGPNGSGKSNLAEAVVWALGEQRAGRLRAGGMADVLYSGGDRRPAAQYAEVALRALERRGGRGPGRPRSRPAAASRAPVTPTTGSTRRRAGCSTSRRRSPRAASGRTRSP